MPVKLYNDVSKLYEQPYMELGDEFICPVCSKRYKTKKGIENHLARQDCHTAQDLFRNTTSEKYIYDCYKDLIEQGYIRGSTSLAVFRKSRSYKPLAKLLIYWSRNKMRMDLLPFYAFYCVQTLKGDNHIVKLYSATSDDLLREFRKKLATDFRDLIDSERFYNENEERLKEDLSFMIRSLERADITINYLMNKMDLYEATERMTPPETSRLLSFLDLVS